MPRGAPAAASVVACLLAWGGSVAFTAPAGEPQATRATSGAAPTVPSLALRDPDGRLVDPFLAAEQSAAIVFLFASVDCPISNRYAPVVQRLHRTYSAKNVAFWLVYPNPGDTPAAVRQHLEAYGYPVHALLDPRHDLVKLTKVSVTPEAAVFDAARALAYRGRIDNRYVSLGVERPAATQHDLADALVAVLAGTPVPSRPAPAVGCFIADFVP
jgi:hypothetical protein